MRRRVNQHIRKYEEQMLRIASCYMYVHTYMYPSSWSEIGLTPTSDQRRSMDATTGPGLGRLNSRTLANEMLGPLDGANLHGSLSRKTFLGDT